MSEGRDKSNLRRHDADSWYPMLMTRAWPFRDLLEEFDDYQRNRHLPELMEAPNADHVIYYENVLDELPEIYKGSGTRLANYFCRDLEQLVAWLSSDSFAAAVQDGGQQWFGRMNELDGDLYTGNIYEVENLAETELGAVDDTLPLLVERFEVGSWQDDFDRWMRADHMPAVAAAPGVVRARFCRAVRDRSPLPYYESVGDRMLIVELENHGALEDALLEPTLLDEMVRSLTWNSRLSYVRRDVYRYLHAERARTTIGGE